MPFLRDWAFNTSCSNKKPTCPTFSSKFPEMRSLELHVHVSCAVLLKPLLTQSKYPPIPRSDLPLLVLEAITETVAAELAKTITIPTIGIGASVKCAGQVLVLHDMLDISPNKKAKFVKNFMTGQPSIAAAIGAFVTAVKDESFPGPEHCY